MHRSMWNWFSVLQKVRKLLNIGEINEFLNYNNYYINIIMIIKLLLSLEFHLFSSLPQFLTHKEDTARIITYVLNTPQMPHGL